jgi:hypothetical protein
MRLVFIAWWKVAGLRRKQPQYVHALGQDVIDEARWR